MRLVVRAPKGNLLSDAERLTAVGRFVRKTSLDEIPQLQPMLLAYRKFFDDHGYDVVVEKIAIRDDKELLAWRCMQPSEKYSSSKRVLPPAASAPAGDDEEKGFEP